MKPRHAVSPLFATVIAAVALAACSSPGTSPQASDSTLTTPPPAPTTTTSLQVVSGDETQQLCDQIKGALPDWRIQTPSLTRPALNVLVQTWGIQHGVTADIVGNRKIIDDITEEQCADTRNEALSALELPDFASGLIGLG